MSENEDLFKEFQEFLDAKRKAEKEEADAEDFEVEIFDEKGRGARTKRSHAKPFLQSLGIDLDPEPEEPPADNDKQTGTPKKSAPKPPATISKKYFGKK